MDDGVTPAWLLSEAERLNGVCNAVVTAGAERGNQFKSAHQKLTRIRLELKQQLCTVKRLVDQLSDKFEAHIGRTNIFYEGPKALKALDAILLQLKHEKIDERFRVPLEFAPTKSLFDFVDTEAIDSLRKQCSQEMSVLNQIRDVARTHVKQIQDKYMQLSKMETVNSQTKASSVTELILSAVQRNIDHQQEVLQNVTKHVTKVREYTSSKTSAAPLDLLLIQGELSNIRSGHDNISALSQHIENSATEHSTLYNESMRIFTSIEQLGPDIRNRGREMHSLSDRFEQGIQIAEQTFEEFRNLTEWYKQFHAAYLQLFQEIPRRRTQIKRQQILLDSFKSKLAEILSHESLERERFFEAHGRYLPPALCPAIDEPVSVCRIVPDEFVSELPELMSGVISAAPSGAHTQCPDNSTATNTICSRVKK